MKRLAVFLLALVGLGLALTLGLALALILWLRIDVWCELGIDDTPENLFQSEDSPNGRYTAQVRERSCRVWQPPYTTWVALHDRRSGQEGTVFWYQAHPRHVDLEWTDPQTLRIAYRYCTELPGDTAWNEVTIHYAYEYTELGVGVICK